MGTQVAYKTIALDREGFKRAKKRKKLIYIFPEGENPDTLKPGDFVIVTGPEGKHPKKRKIKRLLSSEELSAPDAGWEANIYPKDCNITENSVGIQFKYRNVAQRILKAIGILVLTLVLLLTAAIVAFSIYSGRNPLDLIETMKEIPTTRKRLEDEAKQAAYFADEAAKLREGASLAENEMNEQLLALYEQDPDYGEVYSCEIRDGALCAYITKDFEERLRTCIWEINEAYMQKVLDEHFDGRAIEDLSEKEETEAARIFNGYTVDMFIDMASVQNENNRKLVHAFSKFGVFFKTETDDFSGMEMVRITEISLAGDQYRPFTTHSCWDEETQETYNESYVLAFDYYEKYNPNDAHTVGVPITKVDLVTMTFDPNDLWDYWEDQTYVMGQGDPADPAEYEILFKGWALEDSAN